MIPSVNVASVLKLFLRWHGFANKSAIIANNKKYKAFSLNRESLDVIDELTIPINT